MRKDPIKKALQRVQDLRSQGLSEATVAALLELIQIQPGIVVGNAAKFVAQWQAAELAAPLRDAFYRLSEDGLNDDPQCWGKVAIIRALHELAWQDAGVYVKGCRTVQPEPIYGGQEDSAAPVRTVSFQALVQLPVVATSTVMIVLADLLADESAKVRAEAARASVYCPAELTYPLLRLKIRMGDAEPRVLGTCFDALLVLAPNSETVDLILEYTHSDNDVIQAEALASLASSSVPEGVVKIAERYPSLTDPQLKRVLLTSLGGSPTGEAVDFLYELFKTAALPEATWALEALKPRLDDEKQTLIQSILESRQEDDLWRVFRA